MAAAGEHPPVRVVIERDERLLDRIRDLNETLGQDIIWLSRDRCGDVPRADGLRDLGERFIDLGTDLVKRADELDRRVAFRLPADGWIPEAVTAADRHRPVAHYVGRGELRYGQVYLATCGAACFPSYGTDRAARIADHPRCQVCRRGTDALGSEYIESAL